MSVSNYDFGCFDAVIVGAGLSGLTAARLFAESGLKVLVIEKRNEIGGNAFDYVDKSGIRIQKYGPHIFHTDDKTVFEFLSRFTEWDFYEHRVLGKIDSKLVPVPFNLTSLFELFPVEEAQNIERILIKEYGLNKKVPILKLKEHTDFAVRQFAQFVYEKVFYYYTIKQWGMPPEQLGKEVMGRVPVMISYKDTYFSDKYQFMPSGGFCALVANMADHPDITLMLGTDALEVIKVIENEIYFCGKTYGGKVIFTGQVEQLFDFAFGSLPYRSLEFVFESHAVPSYQPAAVVNYTTDQRFTRISEFTKFCSKPKDVTVIVKEFSKECKEGDVPYYPVPCADNLEQYGRYSERAKKVKNLFLLGRLAQYRYINMDVAVKNAMELVQSIIG